MSEDNRDFACPFSGEPIDLCACEEAHGREVVTYESPKAPSPPAAATTGDGPDRGSDSSVRDASTALITAPPAAAPTGRRYAKREERDLEVVRRADRRVRKDATFTLGAAFCAPEIDPDNPVKPEGWSERKFRIAKAAWKSTRECPAYLVLAEKTYSTLVRAEAMSERDPNPQLNCDIQVFVQNNVYNYESIEGDEQK